MATPKNTSYSVGVGKTLYAGMKGPPTWLADLPVGKWREVGANAMNDVNPGAVAGVNPNYPGTPPWGSTQWHAPDEWNSIAFEENRGLVYYFGGGHQGYFGNEVYLLDLSNDTPAWVRTNYPSGSVQKPMSNFASVGPGGDSSTYSDGRPAAVHQYNLLLADPKSGDMLLMPGGFRDISGTGVGAGTGFRCSLSTGDWDSSFRFTSSDPGYQPAGAAVVDRLRPDVVWIFNGDNIYRGLISTGAISLVYSTGGQFGGGYRKLLHDPARDLLYAFTQPAASSGPIAGKSAFIVSLNNDGGGVVSVAPMITSSAFDQKAEQGLVWDEKGGRILQWTWGQANLTQITPPSGDPVSGTWAVSTQAAADDLGLLPTSATTGVFGKLVFANKLGCLLLQPKYSPSKLLACRMR